MSTLATADLHSDSEGDGDFVPASRPVKKRKTIKKVKAATGSGSDSGSSSSRSDDDNEGEIGVDGEEAMLLRAEEAEERKRKAAEAFASFKDDKPKVGEEAKVEKEEMVDVKRERKFAGEIVVETVSLPKSHPEAIAFLVKSSTSNQALTLESAPQMPPSDEKSSIETAMLDHEQYTSIPEPNIPERGIKSSSSTPASKPLPKGPVKRKPRQTLEQLSAGLTGGKKMTTLEKSQMDWKSHVASSSNVADELATNRRSGGFLEKRDFLERVGDRRNDTLESTKKGGR